MTLRVHQRTSTDAGGCNFCSRFAGTAAHPVTEVSSDEDRMSTVMVRFCDECLRSLLEQTQARLATTPKRYPMASDTRSNVDPRTECRICSCPFAYHGVPPATNHEFDDGGVPR
jgi:hypothetical protein